MTEGLLPHRRHAARLADDAALVLEALALAELLADWRGAVLGSAAEQLSLSLIVDLRTLAMSVAKGWVLAGIDDLCCAGCGEPLEEHVSE